LPPSDSLDVVLNPSKYRSADTAWHAAVGSTVVQPGREHASFNTYRNEDRFVETESTGQEALEVVDGREVGWTPAMDGPSQSRGKAKSPSGAHPNGVSR